MKSKVNKKIETRDSSGLVNGYLVPIYNIHEGFHEKGKEPQQVYLTVVKPGKTKGPHLHYIRTGCFTCIKGNIRIITRESGKYCEYLSGEDYNYRSVIIETGIPAMIQNIGSDDAFLLNMPFPAWTPDMDDEHSDDFSNFKL